MSASLISKGLCLVYFLAFASLYIQLPGKYKFIFLKCNLGLIGDDGVAPVRLLTLEEPWGLEDFSAVPTIIRFRESINLGAYHATEFLVVIGLLLAFLSIVISPLCNSFVLLLQWIIYVSVVMVDIASKNFNNFF